MLGSCSCSSSYVGNNTYITIPSISHPVNVYGKKTAFEVPLFLSSSKKKLRTGCHLTAVQASLTMSDLLTDEEVKLNAYPSLSVLKLTATVTVRKREKVDMVKDVMTFPWLYQRGAPSDNHSQRGVVFQLVSTQVDPGTTKPKLSKVSIEDWSKSTTQKGESQGSVSFKVGLVIDADFGEPGAILVSNNYEEEFYLENISLEGLFDFACNSWIQPAHISKEKRIFFTNKAYLPYQTPEGIKDLRGKELESKRGDGKGLRLPSDGIYDYDKYNDIGNADKGPEYARPTLGGAENPHPRRCRSGRPSTITDKTAEKPVEASYTVTSETYVPRDEAPHETRREDFFIGMCRGMLHNVRSVVTNLYDENCIFKDFSDITCLYRKEAQSETGLKGDFPNNIRLPNVLKIHEAIEEMLKFEHPKNISRDALCCIRDDELGRQALAGINPLSIEKLNVFPPVSQLDPSIYGPPESALKEEHIIGHLNGMSVQQALDENKLFILDYHDVYLPFLERINAQEGRKAYGTRTVFFLTPMGTLKPIAIELSLPPTHPDISSKQVLTLPVDATTNWLWQLGKAHVCSNDTGVHQLVHHWLRVHACMEPFIIATHRNLSSMHPVFKILHPHMRDTLGINAMARESLISAEGIIEYAFTPGKYSMQMVCTAYRDWWRFDLEGLPEDLIRRGMAVPDQTQPHGLRLFVEDYPYANDGLLIWSAIQELVRTYVNRYYPDKNDVLSDSELQSWYSEAINVGHADLREAEWWPKLSTSDDLTKILTILIWNATAQHAAVNFGQYSYGGYVPHRPPLMRQLVPREGDPEYARFVDDPEGYFLSSLPGLLQSTSYMAVLDLISAHSRDEEYIGDIKNLSTIWPGEPKIIEAFYRFSLEMKKIENEIEKRNADPKRRNRCGAGIPPYELLIPSSGPGVTGKGIPKSITI